MKLRLKIYVGKLLSQNNKIEKLRASFEQQINETEKIDHKNIHAHVDTAKMLNTQQNRAKCDGEQLTTKYGLRTRERIKSKMYVLTLIWHRFPVNPRVHLHENPPIWSVHWPSFKHGFESHSLYS